MSETEIGSESTGSLTPCSLCGRKFLSERLEKHQIICNKIKESKKKRKVFDSTKQRADLEAVNGFPVTPPSRLTTASEDKKTNNKTSNWRAKHEEFLRTVRQARGVNVDDDVNGGTANGSPRVPVGYIVCDFCGRNFSDKAAERHIQFCREQKARIPRSANNTKALERMKARTKYKPTANKSSPKTETPPQTTTRSQPPTPPVNRKTPPKTTSRSQPPTPPVNRKTTSVVNNRPSPPNSLPNSLKSTKTSPKVQPKNRSTPSPPTKHKSDKQRINSLSRPKNSSPDSAEHLIKQTEPIMKFKEKFPNYPTRVDMNFVKNESLRQLLKKTETYNSGPRTVPGVRTGGMSPIKNENPNINHQNGHYKEDEELEKLKTRIEEMYLNGNTKYKPNSIQNNNNKNNCETNSESTTRGSTGGSNGSSAESSSIQTPPRNNSGGSEGTRSQASSTTSHSLPKFCHQCGTKYPTTVAKYCYECGSRRLGTVGPFV